MQNDNIKTGVIITTPFDGAIQTHFVGDTVAYSQLPLDAYLAQDENLKVITWDEFQRLHTAYCKKPFVKISAKKCDRAYCELPPLGAHWVSHRFHVFYCSEALSGEFHALYVFDKESNLCYAGTKSILLSDTEILRDIDTEILNLKTGSENE